MATKKDTRAVTDNAKEAPEFFTLNGKYTIAPETTLNDVQNDIGCLLECSSAIVNTIMDAANEPNGQLWANPQQIASLTYAADYMLQMVTNLHEAAFCSKVKEASA